MMSPLDLPETDAETLPAHLVAAGSYSTLAEGSEHGLVVLALGRPYWLLPTADGFQLLIEPDVAEVVRVQLVAYARERLGWPPPPIADLWTVRKADVLTPLLWSALVLAIFQAGEKSPAWAELGALDPRAIFDRGEVWRLATALFLHADAEHVISNVLGGLLVFFGVISTLGVRRGWLLLALSAVAGNLVVAAATYPEPYRSLGASTAIFAGIGLLTGRAIRVVARSTHPHRWRSMFVPLAAGLTVLALYGAGGVRVDVGAHLAGFAAGLGCGFIAALAKT